jgi:hypothetical protein
MSCARVALAGRAAQWAIRMLLVAAHAKQHPAEPQLELSAAERAELGAVPAKANHYVDLDDFRAPTRPA